MKALHALSIVLAIVFTSVFSAAHAELKPYVLAYTTSNDMNTAVSEVKQKLEKGGFEVVGAYQPYQYATVIAFTNDALKQAAAQTEFGGYGAVMRASVTRPWKPGQEKGEMVAESGPLEVAYTNPVYWANALRWNDSAVATSKSVASQLDKVLGHETDFGSYFGYKDGISAKDLRKYHYMFGMEYFTDPSDLAEYSSYQKAVSAVENGLARHAGGTAKVYEVKIPGKQQTVFGVALNADNCSGDKYIISRIDHTPPHNTPYAPYQILVDQDGRVYALYARFRIAIAWLGLPMMQSSTGATFFSIMCAPNAIERALIDAAGGQ